MTDKDQSTTINVRRADAPVTDETLPLDDEPSETDHPLPRRRVSASTRLLDYVSRSPRLNRAWKLLPGLCLVVAAGSWLSGHADAAFVIATLGLVAWFIDLRNRLRGSDIEPDDAEVNLKE